MPSELSDGDSALLTVSWFLAGRGQQKNPHICRYIGKYGDFGLGFYKQIQPPR